jgi:glycosyltransferase involved in cell wall biosynthesis
MTADALQYPVGEQSGYGPPSPARSERRSPIKLTYIAGTLRDGGSERQLLELIRHLDRELFSPSVILMEDIGLARARECVDECFVMNIPHAGNSHWLKRSFSLANAVRRTRNQLVAWRSDIVHTITPAASILGGAAARWAQVPVLLGNRGSLVSFYRSGKHAAGYADRIAFHMADLNVGNSDAVSREMILVGGCPAHKAHVIHNGVDLNRFRCDLSSARRTALGWDDRHVVFGMIANFRPCKRHRDFVEVASIVLRRHPEARFLMVGADSGSRAAVSAQIRGLGLDESKVHILDADPHPENIFTAIDIYVCTSETEGFSNVILEAMACGKPVIATDVGGNVESVQDGKTGFLVPCGSPEAVAEAAEKLLADRGLLAECGVQGRRRVEKLFSLERMVHDYEQLYMRLLSERRGVVR